MRTIERRDESRALPLPSFLLSQSIRTLRRIQLLQLADWSPTSLPTIGSILLFLEEPIRPTISSIMLMYRFSLENHHHRRRRRRRRFSSTNRFRSLSLLNHSSRLCVTVSLVDLTLARAVETFDRT